MAQKSESELHDERLLSYLTGYLGRLEMTREALSDHFHCIIDLNSMTTHASLT